MTFCHNTQHMTHVNSSNRKIDTKGLPKNINTLQNDQHLFLNYIDINIICKNITCTKKYINIKHSVNLALNEKDFSLVVSQ